MKMKVYKAAISVAVGGMALIGASAFAAVNVNNVLFDGAPNTTVSAGSNVSTQVYITNDSANDVESLFIKFPGSGGITEQGKCYNVGDEIGISPVNGWVFDLAVLVPANNGLWDMDVSTHGTNGDAADNNCSTTADDTSSFSDRVTVTGGSSIGTGGDSAPTWLAALMAAIASLKPSTPTPPAATAKCTELASKMSGTMQGVRNDSNVRLQGYLLSEGASIPALAAGASFGYYGPQTASAVSWFKSAHQCI